MCGLVLDENKNGWGCLFRLIGYLNHGIIEKEYIAYRDLIFMEVEIYLYMSLEFLTSILISKLPNLSSRP